MKSSFLNENFIRLGKVKALLPKEKISLRGIAEMPSQQSYNILMQKSKYILQRKVHNLNLSK